jgi:hypothetical protein
MVLIAELERDLIAELDRVSLREKETEPAGGSQDDA